MKRDSRITNKDMFDFYPYKRNIKCTPGTIPQPYIKKSEEQPDNPLSVDFNEWMSVVECYIDLIIEILLSGREYLFPNYLGKLQLRKYPTKRLINWNETKKQGRKIYYKENDSLRILLKWYRDYNLAKFQFRFHWNIRMAKKLSRAIHSSSIKNRNYVYNILDV